MFLSLVLYDKSFDVLEAPICQMPLSGEKLKLRRIAFPLAAMFLSSSTFPCSFSARTISKNDAHLGHGGTKGYSLTPQIARWSE